MAGDQMGVEIIEMAISVIPRFENVAGHIGNGYCSIFGSSDELLSENKCA